MSTEYRFIAAMLAPKPIPSYLESCRFVVTKMTGNPSFLNPMPPLPVVTTHLDDLELAQKAAHKGPKGAAKVRNTKLSIVRSDMRQLRAGVQAAADGDLANAQAIIEGGGMNVGKKRVRAKQNLAAKHGTISGLVYLTCKAFKSQGSYDWQMSTDQKTWTDLPGTHKASTLVTGLASATLYWFRYRTLNKAGTSDWSMAVSIIAH